MARRRYTAEEIINKLREAEVGLANGLTVPEVSRKLGVTEQTLWGRAKCHLYLDGVEALSWFGQR